MDGGEAQNTCYNCKSTYKPTEVGPGIFSCPGFCKKLFLQAAQVKAAQTVDGAGATEKLNTSISARSSPRGSVPTFRVNEFCRAPFKGDLLEAVVEAVEGSEATVKFLGLGVVKKVLLRQLVPSLGKAAKEKQIASLMPTESRQSSPTTAWKEGDACRAKYVDGVIYNALVQSVFLGSEGPAGDGNLYANLLYVDYGNVESVPVCELIQPWKVGDYCRAVYSADDVEYEGKLIEIDVSEGDKFGTVEFVGYGNIEVVWMKDIKDSCGEEARKVQEQQAAQSGAEASASEYKAGDFCRALYEGEEYEGEVKSVRKDEEGNAYCVVRFLGYGNEESVWMQDVLVSHGESARLEQLALFPEVPSEPTARKWKVGDFCRLLYSEDSQVYEARVEEIREDGKARIVFIGYGNEEFVLLDELSESLGEEERKRVESFFPAAEKVADTEVQVPEQLESKQEWKNGSFSPVLFDESAVEGASTSKLQETEGFYASQEQILKFQEEKATAAASHDEKAESAEQLRDINNNDQSLLKATEQQHVPTSFSNGLGEIQPGDYSKSVLIAPTQQSSEDADLKAANAELKRRLEARNLDIVELKKRVGALKLEETKLNLTNETIKRGNLELLSQLQAGNVYTSDTFEVATENLKIQRRKCQKLEVEKEALRERYLGDVRSLLYREERFRVKVATLEREVSSLKEDKQQLLDENISLKLKLIK